MELRPLIRRKKLDRGKNQRPFIGPSCSFTSASNLGLHVMLPLSNLISIAPEDPVTSRHCCGSSMTPMTSAVPQYLAQPALQRPAP